MEWREGSDKRIRSSRSADLLAKARHAAALEAYATKKYGTDWAVRENLGDIQDEFKKWLNRRWA